MAKTQTIFILVLLLLFNAILLAQNISLNISGASNQAILLELEGENTHHVDSLFSLNGFYKFNLEKQHEGFYRLQLDNTHWLDFINDGEDIEISTNYNSILDSLNIRKSKSNKLYYEFVKLNKSYKTKTELLQLIIARFPSDDEYYVTTNSRLK